MLQYFFSISWRKKISSLSIENVTAVFSFTVLGQKTKNLSEAKARLRTQRKRLLVEAVDTSDPPVAVAPPPQCQINTPRRHIRSLLQRISVPGEKYRCVIFIPGRKTWC